MLFNLSVLFICSLGAGMVPILLKSEKDINFRLILIFSGAYLFSITIIHILPELFISHEGHEHGNMDPMWIGVFVLVGFFLQLVLAFLTTGVEHGHIQKPEQKDQYLVSFLISLMAGLCVHSILEGALLAHPGKTHADHDVTGLLIGIVIHKIPAAFALGSILVSVLRSKLWAFFYLLIFALASPLGLLLSEALGQSGVFSEEAFTALFAIVGGNFLFISTTIFFESNPHHQYNWKKLLISLFAAGLAVASEFLL